MGGGAGRGPASPRAWSLMGGCREGAERRVDVLMDSIACLRIPLRIARGAEVLVPERPEALVGAVADSEKVRGECSCRGRLGAESLHVSHDVLERFVEFLFGREVFRAPRGEREASAFARPPGGLREADPTLRGQRVVGLARVEGPCEAEDG